MLDSGWASIIGLALALGGLGLYVADPFGDDSEDPFINDECGEYNILILPFAPLQDWSVDTHMEETIRHRLLEISDQDGLGLQVKLYKGRRPSTFTEGREIAEQLNADLVVWGDYSDVCGTELEICVKYVLAENVHTYAELIEGSLQGDIDCIIQWSFGLREYMRSEWELALGHFQSIKKETAELSLRIGYCYHDLGDLEKAISHYTDVIRLNPQYTDIFNNRGDAYYELEKYDQAIADFDLALILNSQNVDVFHKRGKAYSHLKKYDQAIDDYSRVIGLNPQYTKIFYKRGWVYYELEKYDQAIADYNQHIIRNPLEADVLCVRGMAYSAIKEHERAIADYDQVLILLEEHEQTVDYYDKVLNINSAGISFLRGANYMALHKYAQALADYKNFCRLAGPELSQEWTQDSIEILRLDLDKMDSEWSQDPAAKQAIEEIRLALDNRWND